MSHTAQRSRVGTPRPGRVPILLILLLLVVLAAIAGGVTLLMTPDLRMRLTSTETLLQQVLTEQGLNAEAWSEINQRELTPEQRGSLLEGLLDKRSRVGYLPAEDERWFIARLEAGEAAEPLVTRYFEEMLQPRVLRPNEAVAGSPTALVVEMRDYMRQRPDVKLMLFVEGLLVGDSTEAIGRLESPKDIKDLPRQRFRSAVFTPAEPGELTVRFAFWHVYGDPAILNAPIVWNEDGSPEMPEGVQFARRIVIEHPIRVSASRS